MPESRPETRFIFVTGGVVSALGKGIAAASLGHLLVARGLSVTIQKFDPYINVDPGGTVQVIPHITDEIKNRIRLVAESADVDIVITEIGGTVGDIESLPFLEALRQFHSPLGRDIREKIALFANLPVSSVVSARDVDSIYKVPLEFHAEGVTDTVLAH